MKFNSERVLELTKQTGVRGVERTSAHLRDYDFRKHVNHKRQKKKFPTCIDAVRFSMPITRDNGMMKKKAARIGNPDGTCHRAHESELGSETPPEAIEFERCVR